MLCNTFVACLVQICRTFEESVSLDTLPQAQYNNSLTMQVLYKKEKSVNWRTFQAHYCKNDFKSLWSYSWKWNHELFTWVLYNRDNAKTTLLNLGFLVSWEPFIMSGRQTSFSGHWSHSSPCRSVISVSVRQSQVFIVTCLLITKPSNRILMWIDWLIDFV
jgi:hypothetical protein